MRLIDVDETLRLMGYEEEMYQYEENYGYRQAEKFIASQPTIDAITVEWLLKLRNIYIDQNCLISAGIVNEILNLWRIENETD